ncbi:hypothetical protein ACVWW6_006038 [Bradyrhizobium sp. USDA 3311]
MSDLFGGGSTVVQAPTPLPPPTMPDPNSPANIAAGRLRAAQNSARDGRQSTILTAAGSRLPTIAGGALGGSRASGGSSPGTGPAAQPYSSTSL